MEQTWRWFGPDDLVTLPMIRQTGASGIVTALHQIPYGVIWTVEEIERRKRMIAADTSLGLRWSVVESLPVHERIRIGEGDLSELFDNYRQSIRNLAACDIRVICYNFMPVIDWTRTQLDYPLPGGGTALRFDAEVFAAFDCFMLQRKGAEADYHAERSSRRARPGSSRSSESDRDILLKTIMAGLPGAYDRFDIPGLRVMIERYREVTPDVLQAKPCALPARGRARPPRSTACACASIPTTRRGH